MKKIYFILPIIAGIEFGGTGIFIRIFTDYGFNSPTILFSRFTIAFFIMAIQIFLTNKNLFKANLDSIKLIIVAAINILALNIFYNISLISVHLSLAAVLISSAPIFAIIFAHVAFKEKISRAKVISIFLIITGCILTTDLLEGETFNASTMGILAGIAAAIFWANYNIASKKLLNDGVNVHTIMFYATLTISVILLPFADFNWISTFIGQDMAMHTSFLIIDSLFEYVLPYILITYSLKYIDTGTAAILTSGTEPLAALAFGLILYGEKPTILIFIGIILTILALIILSKSEVKYNDN